jgi:hypothetical protein
VSKAAKTIIAALALTHAACGEDEPPAGGLLTPPPAGQGFQITTGDFSVESGTEQQDCYFFRVSDLAAQGGIAPNDVILHRTEIAFRPGGHHMNIYRVRTILGLDPANGLVQRGTIGNSPCSNSVNWADWPLLANSQNDGGFDWTYPDGVGNELMPDEWIMLQTHYVNATTQETPGLGRVDVNLWVIPRAQLQSQLGTVFATKQSIRICRSNPTPTFSGACQLNSPTATTIIGANAHFHSRGNEFAMYVWDGVTAQTPAESERFYTSEEWDDPPMDRSPDLVRTVPPSGGIWYTCSFQWVAPPAEIGCEGLDAIDREKYGTPDEALDCCYTFGGSVELAEHCNVFAYYYPKQDDVACF